MTTEHSGRANGDSFFTMEDLKMLITDMTFVLSRTRHKDTFDKMNDVITKLEKEKAYIEATKCKTVDC